MQKRFLAILAIVTTIFALGVGSALAAKPDTAGPKDPHPACAEGKEDPPDWCEDYDGTPGDNDGDPDPDPDPSANPLTPLCDALGPIDPSVTDVCMQITDAFFGDGAPELPAPPGGGEPGGEPSCADLPDAGLAAGCQQVVDALGSGEVPAPPGGGQGPSCSQIPVPDLAAACQAGRDALNEAGIPV